MNQNFFDMEVQGLLEQLDETDKKPMEMYMRMIGNPNKVKEFCQIFFRSVEENGSAFTICMKIIEKTRRKEFFPVLMEAVQKAVNPIQVQSIFKSCNALPDDMAIVKSFMKPFVEAMQNNMDTEVCYHGVCLMYRIVSKFPEIEEDLKSLQIYVNHERIQNISRRFDILDKWQTANHRGKNTPGYFMNENDFLEFALKFIRIK
ncbi:hypothetical protein [Geosporobacter ferrireducens]|uniref:Uncharacterized protein n=1 Tax=Geosporobacter ferrireducens TaxID=1424294 RepID=A0A1D8GIZ0_9FIRM|nr:hypothetical protein [Geosporobacter ferrireducens]AOT70863.1 hypothetical protein Gferi_15645 [Geosporobacter ferrireducens]MTI53568.1 hypothetical protein [Geosporobacter ferrireducens]